MAAKNWIAGATKNKGALHRSLGVPAGQTIPKGKIAKAANSSDPQLAKRARLAQTLEGMHSPARDTQAFEETFLPNASVPQIGLKTGDPGSYSNPSNGNGIPGAVAQTDGTINPRAGTQTFDGADNPSPTGTKTNWPDIQSYSGENI